MRCLAVLLAALALAGPSFGQEISAETRKDLWCGIAFDLAARDVPADAAPEVLSVTTPYKEGAVTLIGRARAIHLESGYTEEAFEALRLETEAEIAAELAASPAATRSSPPSTTWPRNSVMW
jgi:hypothetical protein